MFRFVPWPSGLSVKVDKNCLLMIIYYVARKFKYIFSEIRPIYWSSQAKIKKNNNNQGDFSKISARFQLTFQVNSWKYLVWFSATYSSRPSVKSFKRLWDNISGSCFSLMYTITWTLQNVSWLLSSSVVS